MIGGGFSVAVVVRRFESGYFIRMAVYTAMPERKEGWASLLFILRRRQRRAACGLRRRAEKGSRS